MKSYIAEAPEVFQGGIIFLIPAVWPLSDVLNYQTTGLWDRLWLREGEEDRSHIFTPVAEMETKEVSATWELKSRAESTLGGS